MQKFQPLYSHTHASVFALIWDQCKHQLVLVQVNCTKQWLSTAVWEGLVWLAALLVELWQPMPLCVECCNGTTNETAQVMGWTPETSARSSPSWWQRVTGGNRMLQSKWGLTLFHGEPPRLVNLKGGPTIGLDIVLVWSPTSWVKCWTPSWASPRTGTPFRPTTESNELTGDFIHLAYLYPLLEQSLCKLP